MALQRCVDTLPLKGRERTEMAQAKMPIPTPALPLKGRE